MGSSRRLTRRPARESPVLFTPLTAAGGVSFR